MSAYDDLMQALRAKREPANEADRNELHDEANTLISAGRNLGIALDAFAMRLATLDHSVEDPEISPLKPLRFVQAIIEALHGELIPEAVKVISSEAMEQARGTGA